MSECENAAPNAAKPLRPRNETRRAWIWLGAYVLVELSVQIFLNG